MTALRVSNSAMINSFWIVFWAVLVAMSFFVYLSQRHRVDDDSGHTGMWAISSVHHAVTDTNLYDTLSDQFPGVGIIYLPLTKPFNTLSRERNALLRSVEQLRSDFRLHYKRKKITQYVSQGQLGSFHPVDLVFVFQDASRNAPAITYSGVAYLLKADVVFSDIPALQCLETACRSEKGWRVVEVPPSGSLEWRFDILDECRN